MRAVVAVGGSVLAPDLEAERVAAYADTLAGLGDDHELGVVVGGGPVARRYIRTARALDADEIACDRLGIGATRLNARLLIAALGERAPPTPARGYEEAVTTLRREGLVVMGGVVAGQTTDAVAAALAERADADLLVYATSVPGVYDADPGENDDATRYDRLAAADLVDLIAESRMEAGAAVPVDLPAAKIIERGALRAVVLDGTDPAAVRRAIATGEFDGTEVVP